MANSSRKRANDLSLGEKLWGIHWPFAVTVLLLGLVGYVVLYSAAGGDHGPWAWRHALRLVLGLALMLVIAMIDIRFWFRWAYWIYGAALLALIAVELVGNLNKGAQRWIDIGLFQLQPSELMKIGLVLCLARYFHPAYLEDVKRPLHLVVPILAAAIPAVLVLRQPDLGTTIMLLAVAATMLFLAGLRWWKIGLALGSVAAALPVVWAKLHDYQKQRVLTFLDPEKDPLGSGYHIIQSKIALGSGGLWGKGILGGSQAQLSFLPEKQTDFAFTMFAEETGFVGAVIVLALYAALLAFALLIALRCTHQFGRLVAMGVSVNFFLYIVINVAMITGMIPVVGVPLPLISYGGTALMTTLIGFGFLLCIDVHRHTAIPRFPSSM